MGCDKHDLNFARDIIYMTRLYVTYALDWYELRRIETSMLWDDQEVNQNNVSVNVAQLI